MPIAPLGRSRSERIAPGFEVLAWEETPLGVLCLRRRTRPGSPDEVVTEVTLDHELLMSSLHTESERALASSALALHEGESLRVLVGGLGLGYTVQAALDSARVAEVVTVEYIPEVIRWMHDGLVPLADALNGDPRLRIEAGDVYGMLADAAARRFDLVLIDVDHSPDEPLGRGPAAFHSAAGLEAASAHLSAAGILGVWSSAPHPAFEQALRDVFRIVRVEPVEFLNRHLGERQTDWLCFARDPTGP